MSRRRPLVSMQPDSDDAKPSDSMTRHRYSRRAAFPVIAGGAFALASTRVGAQDTPPIEPIGPDDDAIAPESPVEIQPEATLPPEAVPIGETVDGSASGEEQYFASTGHNLGTPFLDTWRDAGGFEIFGAPLSEARYIADVVETHQTFETLTFTYDPDLDFAARIQALPLDDKVVNTISTTESRKKVSQASGGDLLFAETGHSLGEPFRAFWEAHGGEQLLGMPLSEPFAGKDGVAKTQVFARVVMDQAPDGTVSLRKLGPQWVKDHKLEGHEAFVASPPNNGTTTLVHAEGGLRLRGGPSLDAEVRVILPDNASFIAVTASEGDWVPGYVDGYSGWVASEFLREPIAATPVDVADWDLSVWQGVALGETNVRAEATTASETVRTIGDGTPVVVVDWIRGEEVVENSYIWAQLDDGNYIFARNVGRAAPVQPPPVPDDFPWEGKWIDIHLTQQLMVAYEGRTPVRTVVTTTGMPGWETPPGWFAINTRVENETMTSGAIGAEYFYKLEDVLYTQYFTDRGHALHYAWWRTPETIGRPGSHGCINLLLEDSKFFWDWATIGTPVIVRTV